MFFALLFGAIGLMRWVVCAANCLADALGSRPGMSGERFQNTQQIR
jgi:hypothetical protein